MRVTVNALALPSFRQGGAGFYTATLIDGLSREPAVDADALVPAELASELDELAPKASLGLAEARPRGPVGKALNYALAVRQPDLLDVGYSAPRTREAQIVHWPISFMNGPKPPGRPVRVLTVLDLQHEFFPRFYSHRDRLLRRMRWPVSAKAADHVIAISGFTRDTVCERYGVPTEDVSVVPLCCRRSFLSAEDGAALPPGLDLPATWFLYPASPLPAKNHARLLAAFASYRTRSDPDARLVLMGPRLHSWETVETEIGQHALGGAVVQLGHVDDATLRALYAQATGLIFPSLFEGFGLPVLEAMTAGCPVAVSDAGSLPEVAGDHGRWFDATDVEAIADALDWLAALDADTRRAMAESGRVRAAEFSPEKMISATVDVYGKVTA